MAGAADRRIAERLEAKCNDPWDYDPSGSHRARFYEGCDALGDVTLRGRLNEALKVKGTVFQSESELVAGVPSFRPCLAASEMTMEALAGWNQMNSPIAFMRSGDYTVLKPARWLFSKGKVSHSMKSYSKMNRCRSWKPSDSSTRRNFNRSKMKRTTKGSHHKVQESQALVGHYKATSMTHVDRTIPTPRTAIRRKYETWCKQDALWVHINNLVLLSVLRLFRNWNKAGIQRVFMNDIQVVLTQPHKYFQHLPQTPL